MTRQEYNRAITRLGSTSEAARLLGITAANVRKRITGVCPIDREAELAVQCLLERRKRLKTKQKATAENK